MSLEFVQGMDIIPLDDIEIEYSRAHEMVRKIVSSFLRDEEILYWVSLIHPKEFGAAASGSEEVKKNLHIGYSLYRCPPELLPNMILNGFSSFSDPTIVEACGFAISVWLAQQGQEMIDRVTERAKEMRGGK